MRSLDWKKSEVENIAGLVEGNSAIGVASIHEIPAREFQSIRRDLRGKADIRVAKKTLIRRALEGAEKSGVDAIESRMDGEIALIFTDMNPFKLFRYLEDNKVSTPAKPGHVAPDDIWVEGGQTSFAPGPIVSELQKVGIPARIERGKVVITKDTLFVKKGEVIDKPRSDVLSKLEIKPMRIGLDVRAIYESGTMFDRETLDVDEEEILGQLSLASQQAFNLAYNAGFFTDATIVPMIQEAYSKARALSINSRVPTEETVAIILTLGRGEMLSLAAALLEANPDSVGEELREALSKSVPPEVEESESKVEKEEEETESEAPEEEEESPGLGALFA